MALSGPQAMRSLDDAVRDIRSEETEIGQKLARGADLAASLRTQQSGLFRDLALIHLKGSEKDAFRGELARAETEARKLLETHAKGLSDADATLKKHDGKIADKARTRRGFLDTIDTNQKSLKDLAAKIAVALKSDPDYTTRSEAHESLSQIANEAMTKTEQAEKDQELKGRPFRADPLFMYLWEAGYSTRNYRANNLVRWLDGLVAHLVGYNDARPNFAMLNEIPRRLRDHAERQAQLAAEAETALDALEQKAIDAAGGKPLREALEKARSEVERIDAEMAALEDERDALNENLRTYSEGRDDAYANAADLLANNLERIDLRQLFDAAALTPTPQDDALVSKIGDNRQRITELDEQDVGHRERLKTLATRRRELEDLEWEFKKSRFDDPRSTFRHDGLTNDLLNEFLRGAITAATYWGAWQKSQSWTPGTTDWGGGVGLPHSGRSFRFPSPGSVRNRPGPTPGMPKMPGSSGGFSRPRASSIGTRQSGGFKTGGGF